MLKINWNSPLFSDKLKRKPQPKKVFKKGKKEFSSNQRKNISAKTIPINLLFLTGIKDNNNSMFNNRNERRSDIKYKINKRLKSTDQWIEKELRSLKLKEQK